MTLLSKCILAGYTILHLLFVVLLDRQVKTHFRNHPSYRRIRWIWILLFTAAAAIPVAAVFLPEGSFSLFLQRIGNVFLAFDLHIAGLFLLVSFLVWLVSLVRFSIRKIFIRHTADPGSRDFSTKSPDRYDRKGDSFRRDGSGGKIFSAAILPIWLLILIMAAGIAVPVYGLHHAQDTVIRYCQADLRSAGKKSEEADSSESIATVPATTDSKRNLRIALIADLHLSVNSHLQTTENMVRLINEQEPDVVLVAGDIFTSSYAALRDPEKYAEALSGIRAPMGVYAVYGNHDVEETLFGGFAVHPVSQAFRTRQIEQFFSDAHFTVLYDEMVELAGGAIQLAGRIDGNKAGDGTKDRLTPDDLLQSADPARPLLVMEHEPVEYKELSEAGADMVLSGHTHNGQIFPGSVYIDLVNENGYGQKNLYGMETFVTSGVGTFGPPMRTGTDSEIMIIDLMY